MTPPLARVLALDVRARRLGFAVFEGPDRMLDFGVRLYADAPEASEHSGVAARKASGLVFYFQPDLVLLRSTSKRSRRNRIAARRVLTAVRGELRALHVLVKIIDERKIIQHFRALGCTNRYHMAQVLAARHLPLAWRLPPKRKPWQSEQAIFMVFDAAALATVHFHEESTLLDPPLTTLV